MTRVHQRRTARNNDLPWLAVYAGTTCHGHVLFRGRQGFEAFDVNDQSLGMFASQDDAVNAIDRRAFEADR